MLSRWILIALIAVGGYYFFYAKKGAEHAQQLATERYADAPGFAPDVVDSVPGQPSPQPPPEGEACVIHGNRYEAHLSARGAGVTHFFLTDRRYAQSDGHDVATTPDIERWRNLRTLFRTPGARLAVRPDRLRPLPVEGSTPERAAPAKERASSRTRTRAARVVQEGERRGRASVS